MNKFANNNYWIMNSIKKNFVQIVWEWLLVMIFIRILKKKIAFVYIVWEDIINKYAIVADLGLLNNLKHVILITFVSIVKNISKIKNVSIWMN